MSGAIKRRRCGSEHYPASSEPIAEHAVDGMRGYDTWGYTSYGADVATLAEVLAEQDAARGYPARSIGAVLLSAVAVLQGEAAIARAEIIERERAALARIPAEIIPQG